MMVYYAYSYRRLRAGYFGYRGIIGDSGACERAAYDANEAGQGCAPRRLGVKTVACSLVPPIQFHRIVPRQYR